MDPLSSMQSRIETVPQGAIEPGSSRSDTEGNAFRARSSTYGGAGSKEWFSSIPPPRWGGTGARRQYGIEAQGLEG